MFLIFIDTSDTWFNALQKGRFPSKGHNIHGPSFSKYLSTMCKVLGLKGQGADEQAQRVAWGAVTAMADTVCRRVQADGRLFLLQT